MELVKNEYCTGCMACVESCPKDCVLVCKGNGGHLFPQINTTICVNCGKCRAACPVLNTLPMRYPTKAYAVWSLDPYDRKTSASGGAASVFYQNAIKNGYYIVGTEYDSQLRVIHTVSDSIESIKNYKQSKYVYSHTDHVYSKVKKLLNEEEKVLFISLPCKIAGLLNYLGRSYENLLTVDIVCHGTPADTVLQNHIKSVSGGKTIKQISFRQDNEFGLSLKSVDERSVYSRIGRTDEYVAAFLENLDYRESCYHCNFAKPDRVADLTVCDFWGLGQELPFNHPYSGSISAVLINSEKGEDFFDSCQSLIFSEERPVEEAIRGNSQLNHPSVPHEKKGQFEDLSARIGFEKAVRLVLSSEITREKKKVLKKQVRSTLRSFAGLFIKRYRS